METIKFSFLIPVYNGEATIEETINSILVNCTQNCEIVVVDNDSTDNTQAIINKLCSENKLIRYYKNYSNFGFDRNCHAAITHARGDYCWFIGDDDLLRPKSLEYVEKILKKHKDLGVIFVNYSRVNRLTNTTIIERDCQIKEDKFFEAGDENVAYVREYPNFVSTLIFHRNSWLSSNYEKYFGTYFQHYGMYLDVIKKKSSYCIAEPLVINKSRISQHPKEPDFWAKSILILCSLISIINTHDVFQSNPKLKREIVSDTIRKYLLDKIKLSKLNGGEITLRNFLKISKTLWTFKLYWLYAPILITPYPAIKYTLYLRNQLRSKKL
jgi:glycosyltransferase involved in cell wall biosynthesis